MAHKLFERFPRLRVAYIENGADWVRACSTPSRCSHGQNPGHVQDPTRSTSSSSTAGWRRSSRTASSDLAKHLPVERILFGSDWPHAEGLAQPRDFFANVASFSPHDQRRIMVDNARELTFS